MDQIVNIYLAFVKSCRMFNNIIYMTKSTDNNKKNLKEKETELVSNQEKILSLNYNKPGSKDKFCEWLRGFTDAEGYFLMTLKSRTQALPYGLP